MGPAGAQLIHTRRRDRQPKARQSPSAGWEQPLSGEDLRRPAPAMHSWAEPPGEKIDLDMTNGMVQDLEAAVPVVGRFHTSLTRL